jgi:ATP-dependent DNA helicase RecG
MEWLDVLARIQSGEDDQTELKRTYDPAKVGPAVCAMANTVGGLVILGVEDDGTIVGVPNPGTVHEKITNFLQNTLSTPVSARVGKAVDPNGTVMWIEVPRQRNFEPIKYDHRVYVRRARSSVEPSASELQDLYNLFGYVVTEERAIDGATIDHVDVRVFEAFMKRQGLALDDEPKVDIAVDLRNRGVLADVGGTLVATVYGVMCFGHKPQSYPQTGRFRIDATVYGGTDRGEADVVDVTTLDGRLDEQVERAAAWLLRLGRREVYVDPGLSFDGKLHYDGANAYDGLHRVDAHRVPVDAFREAIVNAVAHRDYAILGSQILIDAFDDRIEITSPGSLPNHLAPESVMAGGNPRSRNQAMTNFCLVMRLMEGRGRGFPRMRAAMRKHNATVPKLEVDTASRFVRITFDTRTPAFGPESGA